MIIVISCNDSSGSCGFCFHIVVFVYLTAGGGSGGDDDSDGGVGTEVALVLVSSLLVVSI